MRKRYFIAAGLIAAFFCLTLVVLAILPARPGVTKANFDRIEKGMTLDMAVSILGDPLGSFGSEDHRLHFWQHDDGSRVRVFTCDGVVVSMTWIESSETVLERLRRWLQWKE